MHGSQQSHAKRQRQVGHPTSEFKYPNRWKLGTSYFFHQPSHGDRSVAYCLSQNISRRPFDKSGDNNTIRLRSVKRVNIIACISNHSAPNISKDNLALKGSIF